MGFAGAASPCGTIQQVIADVDLYLDLLRRWSGVQNLVSRETLDQVWHRHVADSLQLAPEVVAADRVLDLGSGAGFPALPLAIYFKGGPQQFLLVESNRRKASFLRTVIRELRLTAEVYSSRIEAIRLERPPDVITARALAPLPRLLRMTDLHWGPATAGLFLKGREYVEELVESRALWQFDVVDWPSATDPSGRVLKIEHLSMKAGSAV